MADPILDESTEVARALDCAVDNCIRRIQKENMRQWYVLNSQHNYYDLINMKEGDFYSQFHESVGNSSMHHHRHSPGGTYSGMLYANWSAGLASTAQSALNKVSAPVGIISAGSCTLVSAGGIGSVIGPWTTAASILWDYRGHINANNLHDLIANENYGCLCSEELVGGEEESDVPKDCDTSIKWILERKEADLALSAASVFLAGIPAGVQLAYRMGRERYKRSRWVGDKSTRYPCPDEGAVWRPNTNRCEICGNLMESKFLRTKRLQRHHCRLCGKCCCGKCCFYRATLNDPLRNKDLIPNPKRGNPYDSSKNEGGQLVCNACLAGIRQQMKKGGFESYQTGPERMAQNLVDNATPEKKSIPGCIRAQAAIYCLANGDIRKMLASLIAADGVTAVVRWSKTGVTTLPF